MLLVCRTGKVVLPKNLGFHLTDIHVNHKTEVLQLARLTLTQLSLKTVCMTHVLNVPAKQ